MNDSAATVSGDSSSGNQTVPPPKSTAKKKRNLPGMPGNSQNRLLLNYFTVIQVWAEIVEKDQILIVGLVDFEFLIRSWCWGDRFITNDFTRNEPIRLWNLQ